MIRTFIKTIGITSMFLFLVLFLSAGIPQGAMAEVIPFDSERWVIDSSSADTEIYKGERSLLLKKGIAYVKDVSFTNGIIEFDVAFSNDRGFVGVIFRMQDEENYEEFYMRPHQSGNPDATQYTPVFNGLAGWQLYHSQGFNAKASYSFDQWMHVRLVVSGKNAEVFIGESEEPVLFMHELKRRIQPGMVGISLPAPLTPGHFANFSVTQMDSPPMKSKPGKEEEVEPGTILSWKISSPFDAKRLEGITRLGDAVKGDLGWDILKCEKSGLANISRLRKLAKGKNTVFAKIVIESEKEQIKKLNLGFSDKVNVYLNDNILFGGNDPFLSRDYRFLGSIGYFDQIYLPLKQGTNELWIAVTEGFGGWGLKCRFDDLEGISI